MSNRDDDSRGTASQRRNRRNWIFEKFGDGKTCKCVRCGCELDNLTMTIDRYPKPGCCGGKYVKGNIRPACGDCNVKMGLQHWRKHHRHLDDPPKRKPLTRSLGEYFQHGRQTDL